MGLSGESKLLVVCSTVSEMVALRCGFSGVTDVALNCSS